MFTGLIQHCGVVHHIEPVPTGVRLVIDARGWSHRPFHGESISVNGCCLTLAASVAESREPTADSHLAFDVIHQTLRNTTLGELQPGRPVNLEDAATPSTLLGGHIVQGHVDGVGTVLEVSDDSAAERRLRIEPPEALMEYIVKRGSIAIDGVSLTVASREADSFEVALIPTTLKLTTLGELRPGSRVNLEADYLAKVAIEWVRRNVQGLGAPQRGS